MVVSTIPPQFHTIGNGICAVLCNKEAIHAFWIIDTDPLRGNWDVGLYSRVESISELEQEHRT